MIHQYQNNGYRIVLDVNSGAVHVVDELVYDVIAVLDSMKEDKTEAMLQEESTVREVREKLEEKYPAEELTEALEDITELVREGKLFTKDIYEPIIEDVKKRKTVVKALCLHIAHDCNLACKYCFAEEGEYLSLIHI